MKINVCYTITKNVDMEVSDEFKNLENDDFFRKHEDEWKALVLSLEETILDKLPETAEVMGVLDTETDEIVYENEKGA